MTMKPSDWLDLQDDIEDAIMDSMDINWNSAIGALAVVMMLRERGYQINPPGWEVVA